jgi:hypothetical protein
MLSVAAAHVKELPADAEYEDQQVKIAMQKTLFE